MNADGGCYELVDLRGGVSGMASFHGIFYEVHFWRQG